MHVYHHGNVIEGMHGRKTGGGLTFQHLVFWKFVFGLFPTNLCGPNSEKHPKLSVPQAFVCEIRKITPPHLCFTAVGGCLLVV